jgi:hypothetical protein
VNKLGVDRVNIQAGAGTRTAESSWRFATTGLCWGAGVLSLPRSLVFYPGWRPARLLARRRRRHAMRVPTSRAVIYLTDRKLTPTVAFTADRLTVD